MIDEKPLVIWVISLVGWPALSVLLIVMFGFGGSIYSNEYQYVLSVSGPFIWALFAVFNIIFSFYTLFIIWKKLSVIEKWKYALICITTNVLSAYIMGRFWLKEGINIYSVRGKKNFGMLPFVFYFIIFVSLSIPLFIASKQFD